MRALRMSLTLTVAAAPAVVVPVMPTHAATLTCHGVAATIVGTPQADVIHGTAGRDVIVGRTGNDTIYAGGGNDLVCGGYGADTLYGGAGNDTVDGGHDRVHRAAEDGFERDGDTVHGGPGRDRLLAGVDERTADIIVFDTFRGKTPHTASTSTCVPAPRVATAQTPSQSERLS